MPYRALVDLWYATDPAAIARIRAGEKKVPWGERRERHVYAGQIANDLPAVSVPGLLEKGWIEEVAPSPPTPPIPPGG